MKRLVLSLAFVWLALTGSLSAGLLPAFIERGSVNLRPQQCIAPHDVAVWKDKVFVTGASTSGAGPNVWELDISNPASPYFISSSGVGYKAYGAKASAYGKLYAASWFAGLRIYDTNTSSLIPIGLWDPAEGAFWDLDVEGNRAYMCQGTETTASMHAVDISNPASASQVFSFALDEGPQGVAAAGSYLYFTKTHYSSWGHPWARSYKLVAYNISDESNPYQMTVFNSRHPLGALVQRGDYLYTTWGEGAWAYYDGDGLPTGGDPPYTVIDGSQSYASIVDGPTPPDANKSLRVNDSSTSVGSGVRWSTNWDVYQDGATVLARIRCASAGGDTSSITNIQIEDGTYKLSLRILPDRIVVNETSQTFSLDATLWHAYRITMRNGQFKVYVDEAGAPALTGTTTTPSYVSRLVFGGGADAATQDIYFDYVHHNPCEDLAPNVNGGVDIFDISDRTNPVLVGECSGISSGGAYLMGNYLFSTTSGNGYLAYDVSNPLNPTLARQENLTGYEIGLAGKGRYLYLGNLCGDWEGVLYAIEAFDSDPDMTPPAEWGDFTYAEASWNTEYLGDSLPSAASPVWNVPAGYIESMASASAGVLRVNDNSSSAKSLWVRNWDATNTRGSTVLFRARCASYNLNGGSLGNMSNLIVEDGKYKASFTVLTDRIRMGESGAEYALDGTQWHTYRLTTKGTSYSLYVDEAAAPALTGTLASTTNRARVWFGSSSTLSLQDVYFDYLQFYSDYVNGPSARIVDQTPHVSVSVQDWVDNDSVSGVDPSTAQYYWSTDGGVTWLPNGWDCQYEANQLPTAATPAWTVFEGSESYASVNSGILRVNDNSTASGSKIKWSRSWGAIPSVGTTVLVRAKCNSTGGDTTYTMNVFIEDGMHQESLKIMTDRIVAVNANTTYLLDGTQWHTYRMTTKNTSLKVYVDENPTPVINGAFTTTTSNNRVGFGSGASAGTQDIEFDYFYYTSQGDVAPGQSGGAGQPASCTGQQGDPTGVITATSVPFNQYSETLNKIKFSIRDMAGNIGYSPMYNVRIAADAGPRVLNVTSSVQNKTYTTGGFVDCRLQFDVPVYVSGGSPQIELETGTTDRRATYSGGTGTTILQFSYTVQSGDATPDLDYASANAITLNGAQIRDQYGSNADLRLPQPRSVGSLSYNKDIALDAVRPVVTFVTSDKADGHYKAGEVIDLLLNFSEAVNVTGTPMLELETGSVDRTASYVAGSATATLTFRYTVQPGDTSGDLNYKSTSSLTSTGATIKDIAGNYAMLSLPAQGAGASLGSNKDLVIDTASPGATLASPAGGVYNEPTDVTLTATEPATIYYTTDGSEPTTTSNVYSSPVHLVDDAILRFFAADLAGNEEPTKKQETYTILDEDGSIASVKAMTVGDPVRLGGKGLYLRQGTVGYIEEPSRSAGIRIEGQISASAGELVNLIGTRHVTAYGEPFVQITAITSDGQSSLRPLCLNNRDAAQGLAEGLSLRIWGVVKADSITANSFVISDGSGDTGIKVITQGAPGVIDGQFVIVDGAASRETGRIVIKL